jgi:DNA-binding response OmpR family regulator
MSDVPLTVLVVEDNDDLRELTLDLLRAGGYHVRGVPCAEDVDDQRGALADIYVIDLNLPGEDGVSLARRIRGTQPTAGIVMTTVRTRLDQRIAGYDSGADVYLPKPVEPAELLACLDAVGRRVRGKHAAVLRLDVARQLLSGPSGRMDLQAGEAGVLAALARAPEQTLERWQLEQLFGIDVSASSRTVLDVRVSRLRRKLQQAGTVQAAIQAVPNVGYRLCERIEIA